MTFRGNKGPAGTGSNGNAGPISADTGLAIDPAAETYKKQIEVPFILKDHNCGGKGILSKMTLSIPAKGIIKLKQTWSLKLIKFAFSMGDFKIIATAAIICQKCINQIESG